MYILCRRADSRGLGVTAMSRVTIPFQEIPILFVQIVGKNGKQRELRAVVNTAAKYVIIPKIDAFQLGYDFVYSERFPEVVELQGGKVLLGYTLAGLIEAVKFNLAEVKIGDLVVKDVEAVAYDLPIPSSIDVILGYSFLSRLKTVIDYDKKQITFEEFQEESKKESE